MDVVIVFYDFLSFVVQICSLGFMIKMQEIWFNIYNFWSRDSDKIVWTLSNFTVCDQHKKNLKIHVSSSRFYMWDQHMEQNSRAKYLNPVALCVKWLVDTGFRHWALETFQLLYRDATIFLAWLALTTHRSRKWSCPKLIGLWPSTFLCKLWLVALLFMYKGTISCKVEYNITTF